MAPSQRLVRLEPIVPADRGFLWEQFQQYLAEMSRYEGDQPGAHGAYTYPGFDTYWEQPGQCFPSWIETPPDESLKVSTAGLWIEVGFILVRWSGAFNRARVWQIAELSVRPRFRNRGIGRAVLDHLWERALRLHDPLGWKVHPRNLGAIRLYDRFVATVLESNQARVEVWSQDDRRCYLLEPIPRGRAEPEPSGARMGESSRSGGSPCPGGTRAAGFRAGWGPG